jgi:hypothetical protein
MLRTARVVVVVASVLLASSAARAQAPGPGTPLPLAVDLAKVKVGSWAEYQMSVGGLPPMQMRMALVGRTAGTATIEMSVSGGMMAMAGGAMVVKTVLDIHSKKDEPKVKEVAMQLGSNDPMEMPPEMSQRSQFKRPDPKDSAGEEAVKVKGGTFKAKRYAEKTSSGDSVQFWVSDKATPLGLVKMTGETKAAPSAGMPITGPVTVELTAQGKDARPAITKAAKPFDPETFKREVLGGAAGGPPPEGAAGAPAPAPPGK